MRWFAIWTRLHHGACTRRSASVCQFARTPIARISTRKVAWYEARDVHDSASNGPATPESNDYAHIMAKENEENERHKLRLDLQGYQHYQHRWLKHRIVMQEWLAAGPPPLPEYRLTFGKHKGKRLDEVPDSYMAKYLIPGRLRGQYVIECPIVVDAVEDFMIRNPGVKSQAGPEKTNPIKSNCSETTMEDHSRGTDSRTDGHAPVDRKR